MSVDSHCINGESPSRKSMLGPVQAVGPKYFANTTPSAAASRPCMPGGVIGVFDEPPEV